MAHYCYFCAILFSRLYKSIFTLCCNHVLLMWRDFLTLVKQLCHVCGNIISQQWEDCVTAVAIHNSLKKLLLLRTKYFMEWAQDFVLQP